MRNPVFVLYPDMRQAALDEIYTKTHDPETKSVRPFAYSKNTLMVLLLAEVLSPVNGLCQFLQTRNHNFCSIDNKIGELFE